MYGRGGGGLSTFPSPSHASVVGGCVWGGGTGRPTDGPNFGIRTDTGDYAVVRYRGKGRTKIRVPGRLKVCQGSLVVRPPMRESGIVILVMLDGLWPIA